MLCPESHGKMLVLSGRANPDLARTIAQRLETRLAAATIGTYRDGETQVIVHEAVRGADVYIVQPTSPPFLAYSSSDLVLATSAKLTVFASLAMA